MKESFAAMRFVPLLLAPLALAACSQSAPGEATASGGPAVMATTNAKVEPVPTAIAVPSPTSRNSPMPEVSTPLPTEGAASSCGADKAARFVGKSATPEVRAQVARAVGHDLIRWIGPGDAVTMDYSEARLNADLDERGKITGFRCG